MCTPSMRSAMAKLSRVSGKRISCTYSCSDVDILIVAVDVMSPGTIEHVKNTFFKYVDHIILATVNLT